MQAEKTGSIAVILGATGLVGGHCLRLLLDCDAYSQVVAITRKPLPLAHSRLENIVVDFDTLEEIVLPHVDDVYCCLGTTIKKARSKQAFKRVDLEYVQRSASHFKSMGARHYLLVSAMGASQKSPFFYNQVKGLAESAVLAAGYDFVTICRPSLLLGERSEFRVGEVIGKVFGRVVSPLLGGVLADLKPVNAHQVAKAMLDAAMSVCGCVRTVSVKVIESAEIGRLN